MSYLLRRTKSYSGSELDQTLSRLSGVSYVLNSHLNNRDKDFDPLLPKRNIWVEESNAS